MARYRHSSVRRSAASTTLSSPSTANNGVAGGIPSRPSVGLPARSARRGPTPELAARWALGNDLPGSAPPACIAIMVRPPRFDPGVRQTAARRPCQHPFTRSSRRRCGEPPRRASTRDDGSSTENVCHDNDWQIGAPEPPSGWRGRAVSGARVDGSRRGNHTRWVPAGRACSSAPLGVESGDRGAEGGLEICIAPSPWTGGEWRRDGWER